MEKHRDSDCKTNIYEALVMKKILSHNSSISHSHTLQKHFVYCCLIVKSTTTPLQNITFK